MSKNHIIIRLKRVEGQVRGIQNMVMEDRNYTETLQQITAVQSATKSVAILLLEDYTKSSIKKAVQNGGDEKEIQKLIKTINDFVK